MQRAFTFDGQLVGTTRDSVPLQAFLYKIRTKLLTSPDKDALFKFVNKIVIFLHRFAFNVTDAINDSVTLFGRIRFEQRMIDYTVNAHPGIYNLRDVARRLAKRPEFFHDLTMDFDAIAAFCRDRTSGGKDFTPPLIEAFHWQVRLVFLWMHMQSKLTEPREDFQRELQRFVDAQSNHLAFFDEPNARQHDFTWVDGEAPPQRYAFWLALGPIREFREIWSLWQSVFRDAEVVPDYVVTADDSTTALDTNVPLQTTIYVPEATKTFVTQLFSEAPATKVQRTSGDRENFSFVRQLFTNDSDEEDSPLARPLAMDASDSEDEFHNDTPPPPRLNTLVDLDASFSLVDDDIARFGSEAEQFKAILDDAPVPARVSATLAFDRKFTNDKLFINADESNWATVQMGYADTEIRVFAVPPVLKMVYAEEFGSAATMSRGACVQRLGGATLGPLRDMTMQRWLYVFYADRYLTRQRLSDAQILEIAYVNRDYAWAQWLITNCQFDVDLASPEFLAFAFADTERYRAFEERIMATYDLNAPTLLPRAISQRQNEALQDGLSRIFTHALVTGDDDFILMRRVFVYSRLSKFVLPSDEAVHGAIARGDVKSVKALFDTFFASGGIANQPLRTTLNLTVPTKDVTAPLIAPSRLHRGSLAIAPVDTIVKACLKYYEANEVAVREILDHILAKHLIPLNDVWRSFADAFSFGTLHAFERLISLSSFNLNMFFLYEVLRHAYDGVRTIEETPTTALVEIKNFYPRRETVRDVFVRLMTSHTLTWESTLRKVVFYELFAHGLPMDAVTFAPLVAYFESEIVRGDADDDFEIASLHTMPVQGYHNSTLNRALLFGVMTNIREDASPRAFIESALATLLPYQDYSLQQLYSQLITLAATFGLEHFAATRPSFLGEPRRIRSLDEKRAMRLTVLRILEAARRLAVATSSEQPIVVPWRMLPHWDARLAIDEDIELFEWARENAYAPLDSAGRWQLEFVARFVAQGSTDVACLRCLMAHYTQRDYERVIDRAATLSVEAASVMLRGRYEMRPLDVVRFVTLETQRPHTFERVLLTDGALAHFEGAEVAELLRASSARDSEIAVRVIERLGVELLPAEAQLVEELRAVDVLMRPPAEEGVDEF